MTKHLWQCLPRPLTVLAFAALSLAAWAPPGRAVAAMPVRLRIGVTHDGIVQITAADLSAVGVDPSTVNPDALALSSLGSSVAIRVITNATTGNFQSLQFFGQRFRSLDALHPEMEEKYTDERVYWLDIGGSPGPQISAVVATPQNNLTPPSDFLATVHAEESNEFWTLIPDPLTMGIEDTWYWYRLRPSCKVGCVSSANLPHTIPSPAPGFAATLRLGEIGRATGAHRTEIALNGVALADVPWQGHVAKVFTVTVPANLLTPGTNTVVASAWTSLVDDVYVDYWELDYRRLFRAWEGQLDFRAEGNGPHEYLISGWSSGAIEAWNISDADLPKRLTDATVISNQGETSLRFRADDVAGAHYWLQAADTIAGPASLHLRAPTGLREPATGADAVIVTPADLAPAAQRLAGWHEEHGRRALVVDIQDIYDEFNDGMYHPKAIPLMLAWARDHWPPPAPAYLTLVGDGHWNFKGFNTAVWGGGPNPIPPYLAWVDPWEGEVPADPLYGDWDFDGMPDLAVGRLAVNTLDEANTVVDKIVNYDEGVRTQPWQQRALFVADRYDGYWDFAGLSDQIIATYLPPNIAPQRVYLGETVSDASSARNAILDALQNGVLMVQYSGHGAFDSWSNEQIWRTTDVLGLQNGARLPVVMTFNCWDGYFALTIKPSVAETMQRQPNGGSIAAISPSGLGYTADQHAMRKLLMEVLFQDDVRELGTALLIAKERYASAGRPYYQVATLMFYGDPALRLPKMWAVESQVHIPLVLGAQ